MCVCVEGGAPRAAPNPTPGRVPLPRWEQAASVAPRLPPCPAAAPPRGWRAGRLRGGGRGAARPGAPGGSSFGGCSAHGAGWRPTSRTAWPTGGTWSCGTCGECALSTPGAQGQLGLPRDGVERAGQEGLGGPGALRTPGLFG